jgi:hypothetical protein
MRILQPTRSKLLFSFILLLLGITFFIPFVSISEYWWFHVVCKNSFCGLLSSKPFTLFWVLSGILWGNQSWNEYAFSIRDIFVSPLFYLLIPISYFISSLILSFAMLVTKKNKNKKKYKKNKIL